MDKDPHIKNSFEGLSKNYQLSSEEFSQIKSNVLTGSAQKTKSVVSPWSDFFKTKTMAPALAAIVMVITGGLSSDSQPGQLLYPVKTEVLEELVGFTKITNSEKAIYQNTLLVTRLEELQSVIESENDLTDEEQDKFIAQIREHVDEVKSRSHEMPAGEGLYVINETLQTIALHGNVVEETDFNGLQDTSSKLNDELSKEVDEGVIRYVSVSNTEEVKRYLEEQVGVVGNLIDSETVSQEVLQDVQSQLLQAQESVETQDLVDAIQNILGSQQQLLNETSTPDAADLSSE